MKRRSSGGTSIIPGLACLVIVIAACSPAALSSVPVGSPTSPAAVASAAPTADVLAVARLQGTYIATRTVTSQTGFDFQYKVGQILNRAYAATPTCATGPCDASVVVTIPRQAPPVTIVFGWKNGVFVDDQTDLESGYQCNRAGKTYPAKEAVTHTELRPSESSLVDGAVIATKLATTQHYEVRMTDAAISAGCTPFSVDMIGTLSLTADASAVVAGVSTSGGPRPASDVSPDKSCAKEKNARATGNNGSVSFTLSNETTSRLTVFYLSGSGKRIKQNDMSVGGSEAQGSAKALPWVVADATGRCLLFFAAAAKTFTVR